MPVPTVNNFRFVNKYETEPPSLVLIETYEGFEIFQSNLNELIIVIKHPTNGTYYSFEYSGNIENMIADIKVVIIVFWLDFK